MSIYTNFFMIFCVISLSFMLVSLMLYDIKDNNILK